nr:reverse transcriptase domain-containing protein [Tanacetum cinerariifolium]
MAWDDFKALMREEFCSSKEMQKLETGLWNHVMVRADHVAYTDRFHELARDFPDVFPDDLSGLPHIQEIEFWMELVPGAIPVVKSPYRLAPSELEELSGQLKELQDKDPSKIEAIKNWEAPKTLSGVCSFLGFA